MHMVRELKETLIVQQLYHSMNPSDKSHCCCYIETVYVCMYVYVCAMCVKLYSPLSSLPPLFNPSNSSLLPLAHCSGQFACSLSICDILVWCIDQRSLKMTFKGRMKGHKREATQVRHTHTCMHTHTHTHTHTQTQTCTMHHTESSSATATVIVSYVYVTHSNYAGLMEPHQEAVGVRV